MCRFKHGFANCCLSMIFAFFVCFGMTGCNSDLSNKSMPDAKVDLTPTDQLVIDLPAYEYTSDIYTRALMAFRSQYPNVNVIVNKIGDKNDSQCSQYQTALTSGLMAGVGPDVILTDYFPDLYKTMDAGVFLNLNEIIDADKDFNMDDYVSAVMKAGDYKNGKYIMPIGYRMLLMCGDKITQKDMGFDLSKPMDVNSFFRTAAACPPDKYPVLVGYVRYPWDSHPPLISHMLPMSGICLFDPETGDVLPDESDLIDFCRAFQPYWETRPNLDIDYRDIPYRHSLLLEFTQDVLSQTYTWTVVLRDAGMPAYVTVSSVNGGVAAVATKGVAINGNSKNQLNAWNYIKLLLSDDIQSMTSNMSSALDFAAFPVNKEGLKNALNELATYEQRMGYTEDARDTLHKQLNSVTSCNLPTPRLTDFFMQCMTPYFKGSDSLENCISDLREKLEIYAEE